METLRRRETLAEREVRREREMSTRHVKIDILRERAVVEIPDKVWELIELNERKLDFIKECRESGNPNKERIFPVGCTMVLDTDKLFKDLEHLKNDFINEEMTAMTTYQMETRLEWIFDEYLNYHETYTKYI